MTNLLQCATFPRITHKFLDSLFASSKNNFFLKKKLYLHVLTQLCFLFFIYNYSHQILLISYQLTFPFQLIFFLSHLLVQIFTTFCSYIAMTFPTNKGDKYCLTNQIVKMIPTCKR